MMKTTLITLLLMLTGAFPLSAQTTEELYRGFLDPAKEARPRVWWHWMNGNITKDGIWKDLHWMKRSGIAGFHNFDAGLKTPQVVAQRLAYMTPEWKDAFHYMLTIADSLDMEVTIASSPGWSETGGPWVQEEDGMKKIVWREMDVRGGRRLRLRLPEGFDATGQFQDYSMASDFISQVFMSRKFYRDIAVLAVKVDEQDVPMQELQPLVTASRGRVALEQLCNDRISDGTAILADKNGDSWVQVAFSKAQTIKSLRWSGVASNGDIQALSYSFWASNDGLHFRKITDLGYQGCVEKTANIPATTAKYFRLGIKNSATDSSLISMLQLFPVNRVELSGDKAAFAFYRYASSALTPAGSEAVPVGNVINVTRFVHDGVLNWKAPKGRWRIYRIGYGLTGKTNHPASLEATGLEVDKLDPEAIRTYYKNYLDTYLDASQGMMGKRGIQYILTDSYEAGPQTWTIRMREEFMRRRGYDLMPWIPALLGLVVGSAEETDRFLFDWRMTLGEMMAEYHYDMLNDILKEYGLKRYSESHEAWRANMTDGMDCKRTAHVPMSAIWMKYKQGKLSMPQFEADIRESASVAHIYGQNIAAAESFTTNGYRDGALVYSPSILKPTADAAMACGLNRFVIHTSPHQPVDDKFPGIGLGVYGQWFDRHETWADQAGAWTDYLARSCHLLQQGRFVADVATYYGEDTNITGLYMTRFPSCPQGYAFDFVSPSALKEVLRPSGGLLRSPSGMEYRVLQLINVARMSLPVLRRIAELAEAGVVICGDKPSQLTGREGSPEEFRMLVEKIWNSNRTNVFSGTSLEQVLAKRGIEPDVDFLGAKAGLRYVHRHLAEGEIYWIANQTPDARKQKVSFRVTGKKPQVWHADTGAREPISYEQVGERTVVDLQFSPYDAQFIVFVDEADVPSLRLPAVTKALVGEVNAPWDVRFQPRRGAPEARVFDTLASYTASSDPGVKYFSGTATYTNAFVLGKELFAQKTRPQRIILDLGAVRDLAEVYVNGRKLGVVWHAPFRMDVTEAVKAGRNTLEIKVVNVWHNRLVGDVQPGAQPVAWTQVAFYKPDEPLLEAGLLGPVRIEAEY